MTPSCVLGLEDCLLVMFADLISFSDPVTLSTVFMQVT